MISQEAIAIIQARNEGWHCGFITEQLEGWSCHHLRGESLWVEPFGMGRLRVQAWTC